VPEGYELEDRDQLSQFLRHLRLNEHHDEVLGDRLGRRETADIDGGD
jgi:hypothetical protein